MEETKTKISDLENKKSDMEIARIKLESIKEKESAISEIREKKKQIDSEIEVVSKRIKSLEENISQFLKFIPLFEQKQRKLQEELEKEKNVKYAMPVFYFTELMGVAFDIKHRDKWFKRHIVNPIPLLQAKGLI